LGFVTSWLAALLVIGSLVITGAVRLLEGGRPKRSGWILIALAAGMFLAFLRTPFHMTWPQTMVGAQPRWLPLLWVVVLAAAAPIRLRGSKHAAVSLVPAVFLIILSASVMLPFAADVSNFRAVVERADEGARTLVLIEQEPAPDRAPAQPLRHFGAYLMAAKGGIVSNIPRWAASQAWVPVRLVTELPGAPPPGYSRSFRFDKHGDGWDQFLVYDRDPAKRFEYFQGAPVTLVVESQRWRLYRRRDRR
jgi:hypothetical protein